MARRILRPLAPFCGSRRRAKYKKEFDANSADMKAALVALENAIKTLKAPRGLSPCTLHARVRGFRDLPAVPWLPPALSPRGLGDGRSMLPGECGLRA